MFCWINSFDKKSTFCYTVHQKWGLANIHRALLHFLCGGSWLLSSKTINYSGTFKRKHRAACLASLELVGGLAEVFINQQPHPSLYVLVKSSGFHISNEGYPKCNNREDCRSSLAVFATIPVSCPELTKACKVTQPRIIAMPNLITSNFYDLKKPQTDKQKENWFLVLAVFRQTAIKSQVL